MCSKECYHMLEGSMLIDRQPAVILAPSHARKCEFQRSVGRCCVQTSSGRILRTHCSARRRSLRRWAGRSWRRRSASERGCVHLGPLQTLRLPPGSRCASWVLGSESGWLTAQISMVECVCVRREHFKCRNSGNEYARTKCGDRNLFVTFMVLYGRSCCNLSSTYHGILDVFVV